MPSPSSILALALVLGSSSASVDANLLDSFSKVHSQNQEALVSPAHKDTKWLVFPQQQELHAQSLEGSLRATHEKVSPETFFSVHNEALGIDQNAVFTKHREFGANDDSVTHQRYKQSIGNIPVFGGDFHLTVGSHDGGR